MIIFYGCVIQATLRQMTSELPPVSEAGGETVEEAAKIEDNLDPWDALEQACLRAIFSPPPLSLSLLSPF